LRQQVIGSLISNSIEGTTMTVTAMKFVCGLLAAIPLAALTLGNAAFAQQFSGQTVTMIVNFTAGGPTDIATSTIST